MSGRRTPTGLAVASTLSDEVLIGALSEAARGVAAEAPLVVPVAPLRWRGLAPAPAPRWRRLGLLAGLAGAAATAALLVAPRVARQSPLTFEVRGDAVESGGYVRAVAEVPGPATGQVHFSDGTEIKLLDTESRLSVVAPNAHGARLRLDTGRAQFWVQHLPHAAWSVEAGPYVVHVTGTVFDVHWSSRDEQVEVSMHAGSVRVTGPGLSDAVPLRAGQRLTARPARGEVKIERMGALAPAPEPAPEPEAPDTPRKAGEIEVVAPPVEAVVAAPAPAVETRPPVPKRSRALAWADSPRATSARVANRGAVPPVERAVPPESSPATEPPPLGPRGANPVDTGGAPPAPAAPVPAARPPAWTHRRWSESVAAGDAATVLADAEQVGVGVALQYADRANLEALADAARYQGRSELAMRALTQQRTRFPGTRDAARAAFLLGRLADDRGALDESTRWYGRYLAEAPRGVYADEALGRLMLAIQRRQGRKDAAPLAEDYLRRFPNGTYLLQARAILQGR